MTRPPLPPAMPALPDPAAPDAALLDALAAAAREAGEAILAVRARGFTVTGKHDDTPVTEADHAAEAILLAALARLDPATIVVAEEEVAAGRIPPRAERFWLVDPLDGTREFAKGRREFTVNVGLVEGGRCVLGICHVPAYGEMFAALNPAAGPRIAWKEDAAGRRPIAARRCPPEGPTAFASSHFAADPRLARFLRERGAHRIINIGSALKFCRVAEGAADLYPRFGPTMEWDTAAPQAVVEAAGGHVRLFDGSPLAYGKRGFRNPDFLVTGAE